MPLIDVVFLLLIFFLITTTFVQPDESTIAVNLPEGVAGQQMGESQSVTLVVTSQGAVAFEDGTEAEGEDLRERLRSLREENPDLEILLRGDREATHGRVTEILDTIQDSGFRRVNLIISRPESR